MSKEKGKHDGLLCFLLALIVVLILIIGGGAYYFLVVDNGEEKVIENEVENIQSINNSGQFTEFKILRPKDYNVPYPNRDENSKYSIIAKNINNEWTELIKGSPSVIIGTYANKLYYTVDEVGILYIDLTKTPYTAIKWIEFEDCEIYDDVMAKLHIGKARMIEDTIYFEYFMSLTGGIHSIKVTDNSIDDAIQVIPDVNFHDWEIDIENKKLYYKDWKTGYLPNGVGYNDLAHSLIRYDLETGKKDVIIEGIIKINETSFRIQQAVEDFELYGNNILCVVSHAPDEQDANGNWSYGLNLYNGNTMKGKLICTFDRNLDLPGKYVKYYNNDVYYQARKSIIKFNNGKNDVIFTYTPTKEDEYLDGFSFVDNNIIELNLENSSKKYVVNGKLESNVELKPESTYSVKMLDGTIQEITSDRIY